MIIITENAQKYMSKKKINAVTIEYPDYRSSCCGANVPVAEIFPKVPRSPEKFVKKVVDGIEIYLSKALILPEGPITIDTDTMLMFTSLTLKGFRALDYFKA